MTQSTDVFRTMTDEEAEHLMKDMREGVRPLWRQLERVAAATLRLRPVFLGRQPFPKRCALIRKAMSLKPNAESAAELLSAYFMERQSALVIELLDALGVEHDEGALRDAAPKAPSKKKLQSVVAKFREGDDPVMRGLLLKAFAAQSAIDWPELDALVFPETAKAGV